MFGREPKQGRVLAASVGGSNTWHLGRGILTFTILCFSSDSLKKRKKMTQHRGEFHERRFTSENALTHTLLNSSCQLMRRSNAQVVNVVLLCSTAFPRWEHMFWKERPPTEGPKLWWPQVTPASSRHCGMNLVFPTGWNGLTSEPHHAPWQLPSPPPLRARRWCSRPADTPILGVESCCCWRRWWRRSRRTRLSQVRKDFSPMPAKLDEVC